MSSSDETGVLEFRSSGFHLYLPPTTFESRFVMFDDSNQIFYDIDYETKLPGNKTDWSDLAPENLSDPAIVFPPEQCDVLNIMQFATGLLVSITQRQGDKMVAKKLGRVLLWHPPSTGKCMMWRLIRSLNPRLEPKTWFFPLDFAASLYDVGRNWLITAVFHSN